MSDLDVIKNYIVDFESIESSWLARSGGEGAQRGLTTSSSLLETDGTHIDDVNAARA